MLRGVSDLFDRLIAIQVYTFPDNSRLVVIYKPLSHERSTSNILIFKLKRMH